MSHNPEFSRRVMMNRIGGGIEETVEANETERKALAARFGIPSVDKLVCRFRLTPVTSKIILAEGWIAASVHQSCVITDEIFADALAEAFNVRFIPLEDMPEDEFDIDSIDLDAIDEVPHDGRAIDLGEAASEQLALMLDPYPRKPGAGLENAVDVAPREGDDDADGLLPEDAKAAKPNPFAALAALKSGKKGE